LTFTFDLDLYSSRNLFNGFSMQETVYTYLNHCRILITSWDVTFSISLSLKMTTLQEIALVSLTRVKKWGLGLY